MAKQFSEYAEAYENARMERKEGILEVTMHSRGGPLEWSDSAHTYLPDAFYDIAHDPGNRVVILTTEGDVWCDRVEPGSFILDPAVPPVDIDRLQPEAKALVFNLLDIRVPVIAAIPGPASVHPDLGLVADVVLASDTAFFQVQHFGKWGIVPGDGNNLIYPLLLGANRGRHYLFTSEKFTAQEALDWGIVAEVLSAAELKPRARELAATIAEKPILGLRYTREAINIELRRLMQNNLGYGLALEAYSSGAGTWPGSTLHD